jgi:arginase family enzyme
MNEHGVLAFYMDDVRRLGIEAVVRKCIEHVSPE